MFAALGEAILPEKIRKHIHEYVMKTGQHKMPYSLYGGVFMLSVLVSIIAYGLVVFPILKNYNIIFLVLGSFISLSVIEFVLVLVTMLLLWMYYEFQIFSRVRKIEEVLPDFLEQVSINLKAGMSFDKALWNSVEPEFGVLEKEIEIVAKKVMAGDDTEEAIKEFANKYDSTLLQESMDMILVGIRSGGDISDLIDRIVDNVKKAYFLKKELVASVTSYIIFITIIAIVISPMLFALSFNLMEIIQGLGEKLSSSSAGGGMLSVSYQGVNPEDFVMFSKVSILIISIIASMIIAELREGSIKSGIKYIFVFTPVAYLVYLLMLTVFTGIFGAIG